MTSLTNPFRSQAVLRMIPRHQSNLEVSEAEEDTGGSPRKNSSTEWTSRPSFPSNPDRPELSSKQDPWIHTAGSTESHWRQEPLVHHNF